MDMDILGLEIHGMRNVTDVGLLSFVVVYIAVNEQREIDMKRMKEEKKTTIGQTTCLSFRVFLQLSGT